MRHKPRDPAIATQERVNPEQSLMRRRCGKNRIGPSETAIGLFESLQKAWNSAGADGDMAPDPDVAPPQFAGDYAQAFLCIGVFNERQIGREQLAETGMRFADTVYCHRAVL